jgi:hypothetical protein
MFLVTNLQMGPTLAVHVVNNALAIMADRYPAELVRSPLPAEFDLRTVTPLTFEDHEHAVAKSIFNRRVVSGADLTESDVIADLKPLNGAGQVQVFVALFYMFGMRLGTLKYQTGIE